MSEREPQSAAQSATEPRTLHLLRTKTFIPRAHPDLVPRARLLEQLEAARQARLILVCAPAGFGKTTLLADWLKGKAAWVSLDAGDNAPHRFWAYVALALGSVHPHLGASALDLLQAPRPPQMEAILTDLLNEMAGVPDPFVLVLDDYHVVESPEIHTALAFFLQNLPAQARLVIASRRDPPLPLATLRSRRELLELRAAELRFTQEEAATLLNRIMNLGLTGEDVAALEDRIEGWAAGLQLAALSMQREKDIAGFIRAFTGSHRYVFDYLAQEVLLRQPEPVRTFLLETALLERLSAPLCDAVTDRSDGQAMLNRLEEANLFLLPLDQERRWYRYHHLFADFLRVQLTDECGAERVAELHRRASAWYEENGWVEEAVHHARATHDDEFTAHLIERVHGEMFERSELALLLSWLAALPRDVVEASPRLCISYAWALLATGQNEKVEPFLQAIEKTLGADADQLVAEAGARLAPEVQGALTEITIMRSSLAVNHFDVARILELCRRVLPFLDRDLPTCLYNPPGGLHAGVFLNMAVAYEFSGDAGAAIQAFEQTASYCHAERNFHILPVAMSHLAQVLMVQGRLHRAAETYRAALQQAQEIAVHFSPLSGAVHAGLGLLTYEWNELEAASDHLSKGIALGKPWNSWEALLPGYLGLARIQQVKGDVPGAWAKADELIELCTKLGMTVAVAAVHAFRARLYIEQGRLEEAARWADASGLGVDQPVPYLREAEALILARVRLAQGRLAEAQSLLQQMRQAAEAGGRGGRVIEILVLQSLAFQAGGETTDALAALERALALAEPEGYVRTFIDEGEPMHRLLHRAAASGAATSYANRLLAAFGQGSGETAERQSPVGPPLRAPAQPASALPGRAAPADSLSARELEVLQLVADGLTNQEIADRLTVSLNTVKTHVKNIFAKLQASNRPQAIARARERKLL